MQLHMHLHATYLVHSILSKFVLFLALRSEQFRRIKHKDGLLNGLWVRVTDDLSKRAHYHGGHCVSMTSVTLIKVIKSKS